MTEPANKKQKISKPVKDAEENIELWKSNNIILWKQKLEDYQTCIVSHSTKMKAAKSQQRLVELDSWYFNELPTLVHKRVKKSALPHVTCEELVDITEWKMMRGKWRPKNKSLVASNTQEAITDLCTQALDVLKPQQNKNSSLANIKKAISLLSELKGVGPATASAVLSVFDESIPFMSDEATIAVLPGQPLKYTLPQTLSCNCRVNCGVCFLNGRAPSVSITTSATTSLALIFLSQGLNSMTKLIYMEYATKMQQKTDILNKNSDEFLSCKQLEKAIFCDVINKTM